jgi:hypothetical protein
MIVVTVVQGIVLHHNADRPHEDNLPFAEENLRKLVFTRNRSACKRYLSV